jgi:hypothetical protein
MASKLVTEKINREVWCRDKRAPVQALATTTWLAWPFTCAPRQVAATCALNGETKLGMSCPPHGADPNALVPSTGPLPQALQTRGAEAGRRHHYHSTESSPHQTLGYGIRRLGSPRLCTAVEARYYTYLHRTIREPSYFFNAKTIPYVFNQSHCIYSGDVFLRGRSCILMFLHIARRKGAILGMGWSRWDRDRPVFPRGAFSSAYASALGGELGRGLGMYLGFEVQEGNRESDCICCAQMGACGHVADMVGRVAAG